MIVMGMGMVCLMRGMGIVVVCTPSLDVAILGLLLVGELN